MAKPRLFSGPVPFLKPAVFLGSLFPLLALAIRATRGQLGANPIATGLNQLGLIALVFLIASLVCTPIKIISGWTWPIRIRRMLGLFAFFYACLHVATYTGIDQGFDWRAILADVTKRKFIFVGFSAFVLLIPLATTSTNAMVRRIGFARWKLLHRLVYASAILGVIHFIWRVKKDVTEPVTYGVVLGVLFAVRILDALARARRAQPRVARAR